MNSNGQFMGIKLSSWPDDRIFSLLLKLHITEDSGPSFIDGYMNCNLPTGFKLHSHMVKASKVGVVPDENFKQGIHYLERKEAVINTRSFLKVLSGQQTPDRSAIEELIIDKNVCYLTFHGITQAMKTIPRDEHTAELKTIFKQILFWAAVMTDTENGKNPYGS
jgi:hypothetical protein